MFNNFTDDKAYVSTKWIIRLVINQGLQIHHIFRVKCLAGVATHYVIVLQDGWVICDCCMGLNLGIPCRHYFQLYTKVEGLTFSIGIMRAWQVFFILSMSRHLNAFLHADGYRILPLI